MSHLFVSYSRKDSGYVKRFFNHTQKLGFHVWYDLNDIEGGDNWWEKIAQGIEECGAFVVIMSPNSAASGYVKKEYHLAYDCRKPILPILLDGKVFSFFREITYYPVKPKLEGYKPSMPRKDFYHTLEKYVTRTPKLTPEGIEVTGRKRASESKDRQKQAESVVVAKPVLDPDETKVTEIDRWKPYDQEGGTNYYGIAMLSLAYEDSGTYKGHLKALELLRRACMIEPNVKNKDFMTSRYGWGKEQHDLLEKLLKDPKFGKLS